MTLLLWVFMLVLSATYVLYWVNEGMKLKNLPGYVPPKSRLGQHLMNFASPILVWWGVGPVQVVGLENIRKAQHIRLVATNHQLQWDFAVLQKVLPFITRNLIAENQLTGIRKPLAALTGTICVRYSRKEGRETVQDGKSVVSLSVQMLAANRSECLSIFPQGQMYRDNQLRPDAFGTGAVRIMRQLAQCTGASEMDILPVGIHYLRHPDQASGIQRLLLELAQVPPSAGFVRRLLSRLLLSAGTRQFRSTAGQTNYGAIVVVGEPIPFAKLPDQEDAGPGTQMLSMNIRCCVAAAQRLDNRLDGWTENGLPVALYMV